MMIELIQLNKYYQINHKGYHALSDINLKINRGDIVGIVGASGAGKSTLLRSVNLLERPTSGEVHVNGVNLTRLTHRQLKTERRHIGMIFQHFNLLESRTAYHNIALPLELMGKSSSEIDAEVSTLLKLVNLEPQRHQYPSQLSGGQKQRVAIARALATKSQVLLCDEPTSALDAHSTLSILSLLKTINQQLGVTILLITHELDVVKRICDHVGVLHHGKLLEYAKTLDIFAKPQSPVTRQLVQTALHSELPASLASAIQATSGPNRSCLVRLTFTDNDSHTPLITTLIRQFDITISIVQANIETIQESTIGFTVCLLSGCAVEDALAYVKQTSIAAEVLGYV